MEQLAESSEKTTVSPKSLEDSNPKEDTPAPSKKALKKAAKEAEKAKKKAETAARLATERATKQQEDSVDISEGKYGVLPLIQSTTRTGSNPSCFMKKYCDY
jgi:aspartyl-tRNA synthetase